MQSKLADFNSKLKQSSLDGFIVTNPTNIFYLTGFKGIAPQERESILVFNTQLYPSKSVRQNSGRSGTTLITARLYQNEARKKATKSQKVKIVNERHQIFEFAKNLLKNATRIGFEQNDLTFGEYQEFSQGLNPLKSNLSKPGLEQVDKPGLELVPTKNLIENLRIIKTADEIQKIEKAQIISQKAYAAIIKTIKVGQTEEEVAERLAKIIKSLGGHGLAFESIVASGPNAGLPHYITGKKKIKSGEVLLFDFGAKYQNYMGDLSRTVFIGKANDRQRNIYTHVQTAQRAAIDKIRSGVKSSEVYNEANNHFKKHALAGHFLHGAGHGIGLEIHENPYLRPESHDPLLENMVTSVEPGLYFPWGGIRIEDLVTANESHAKILGRKSPELIEIS